MSWSANDSRSLLLDMAVEFFDAADDPSETKERARELAKFRRRSALRLVSEEKPKMGYEHLYWKASEPDPEW